MKLKHLATTLWLGALSLAATLTPVLAQSGCHIGIGGAFVNGNLYDGPLAPIGISVQGQKADVQGGCDHKLGQSSLVAGIGAAYGLYFGDVKDAIGVDNDWRGWVRLGLMTAPDNMVYTGAGYTQVRGSGGHANGYLLMLGDEMRLAGTPLKLDLRTTYVQYDPEDFGLAGTGLKTNAYEFRIGLNWQFWDRAVPAAKPMK